jgi:dolichol-phosphate mannosyltransferase
VQAFDLTIIIPTLNEEANIGKLCDEIQGHLSDVEIIVVDDGSEDKTQEIVRSKGSRVTLLDRSKEEIHGLTISIRDAIDACTTDTFMIIDGDFQHPPESLLDAYKCFEDGADLVIGYRIEVEDWPFLRKLMSLGAQWLAQISLFIRRKQRPKDVMSGFFGGKVKVVQPLMHDNDLALKGYKLLFDILKVLPNETTIKQFGYIFKNREFGDSKIGKLQIWEFFKSVF